jgi:hypothetical protein
MTRACPPAAPHLVCSYCIKHGDKADPGQHRIIQIHTSKRDIKEDPYLSLSSAQNRRFRNGARADSNTYSGLPDSGRTVGAIVYRQDRNQRRLHYQDPVSALSYNALLRCRRLGC